MGALCGGYVIATFFPGCVLEPDLSDDVVASIRYRVSWGVHPPDCGRSGSVVVFHFYLSFFVPFLATHFCCKPLSFDFRFGAV